MSRILAQDGNVIAADFRPRVADKLNIEIKVTSDILYCDQMVCLMRFSLVFAGQVIATQHVTVQQHGTAT